MTTTSQTTNAADPLAARIDELRRLRGAVILAHNYQLGEIQDLADVTGDSLDLSRRAAETDASAIVFCGVRFMAETAAVLSRDKVVLHPEPLAGCPLADMITADELRRFKDEHPGAPVVCYVNTSAEVKAESDYCCTSANATRVVEGIPADDIIFVPDHNLGLWVQRHTSKRLLLWPGYCPTHHKIMPEDVRRALEQHPDAEVVAHPECRPEVLDLAHQVLSTSGIIRHARDSAATTIIVATELGIIHRLRKEAPDKRFIPVSRHAVCPNMKRITLEKVLWSLEDMSGQVHVPHDTAARARKALDRMLEVT
ncbi:MAG: quinolinate synthase NadA [Armatimonadota bacterium]|nr:MAG: quinolinate synthase NadA [Armatimonadota bacterium]